jgi:membrane-associated phospholipid phosphatase
MFTIILSTMFIKQHSTFDVFTAMLLAYVMNLIVYKRDWSKTSQRARGAFFVQ